MSGNLPYLPDTEQLIINGCIARDRASQTRLYDFYAPKMLVVCMRYSKNREEAEEILHEGFCRVFKYINKFQNAGSFEGWIRKIIVNAALQRYKSKSSLYPVIQIDEMKTDLANDTDLYNALDVKELMKVVQTLPTGYRLVFNLYAIEGFKHREIAEMLGISEGTSKSNLSDARVFLQKALAAKKKIMVS